MALSKYEETDWFIKELNQHLTEILQEQREQVIADAMIKFEELIRKQVAITTMAILERRMSVERFGNDLIIKIDIGEKK